MLVVKKNLVIKITNTQTTFTYPNSGRQTPEQDINHAKADH